MNNAYNMNMPKKITLRTVRELGNKIAKHKPVDACMDRSTGRIIRLDGRKVRKLRNNKPE